MKKFLVWPGFVILGRLLFSWYESGRPCNGGLFVGFGFCALGELLLNVLLIESLLLYTLGSFLYWIYNRRKHKKLYFIGFILIGLFSLFLVVGGFYLFAYIGIVVAGWLGFL